MKSLSHVLLFATLWAVACQAPPSMGFSRQECWSGLLFPPPEDLPDPGTEPSSPALTGGFFTNDHWEALFPPSRAVSEEWRASAGLPSVPAMEEWGRKKGS